MSKSCHKKSRRIPRCAGLGCRKSGLRHFFEVFIAPLRLRRGQGAMQGNPCYARPFADLTRTPQGAFSCPFGTIHLVSPNPIKASGGQSRAPPVAGEARRKPSEQGSARKAPRADAARPLRTALRPPNPRGFFDRLSRRIPRCAGLVLPGCPYLLRRRARTAAAPATPRAIRQTHRVTLTWSPVLGTMPPTTERVKQPLSTWP